MKTSARTEFFAKEYAEVFEGDKNWNSLKVPTGSIYEWSKDSTYIKQPPYFDTLGGSTYFVRDLSGLRALAVLGDSVTTDHISPAGSIALDSPAAKYLMSLGREAGRFQQLWRAAR